MFDRVFSEKVDQEGVWEYIKESVNAFVQGYNVSVLAYGQSGAGKSYTMGTSGPAEQNDSKIKGKTRFWRVNIRRTDKISFLRRCHPKSSK